jgi:hypothetical protein
MMERRSFLGGVTFAALHPGPVAGDGDVSRVYDVRRFGALGDGRTDDTASIRRALAELGKAGGILALSPGDYVVSGPLDLPASAVWHIRGAGRTTTRLLVGGSAAAGELFRCSHAHVRRAFGCSIEDLTIDAAGLPGTVVYLDGLSLFGMRGVSIIKAAGSALSLVGLFDSYFEDVFLEACGTPSSPVLTCTSPASAGGDSMNNCVFVNLHVETNADAVHVQIDGTPVNRTDTLQFYGLKCHGSPKTGMPGQPLLRLGQHAIGCSFIGGIMAWGKGVSQVEVDGARNKFIGIDHGAGPPGGSPQFAYRFTANAVANHILTPNFKNGVGPTVYRSAYVRVDPGASHTKFVFPQMSTGPMPIDRVLSDQGLGTLFLGDDINDAGGLYIRHGQGFNVLRANGISATTTPAWNLRGNVTLAGGSDHAEVRFVTPEADAEYFVTCTVVEVHGSPPSASRRHWIGDKTLKGFRVHCEEAPGGDNSVTADWILVR